MRRLWFSACAITCLVLAANPALAQSGKTPPATGQSAGLPNLGDGSEMTSSAERRLGDRIVRELYRDPDYIDDPVLFEYVQAIWQPLLAAARLRGDLPPELDERFAWEVLMGRDRTINAFALPGGYFGLHLGLMAAVGSRDELASVMGHELSHVTQRHISRLISKQNSTSPWLVGAMILGVLAASKSQDAANALVTGSQAVAAQTQLNFSRDMEREADRVGFGVMTQAGFDGQGFVTMFDKLQQASRLNDRGNFPYLRGHPLTTERIADMQARVRGTGGAVGQVGAVGVANSVAPIKPGAMEDALISARARVLSNPGVDDLHVWAALVADANFAAKPKVRQAAELYGATLAALKLRDLGAATRLLASLQDAVRADAPAARLASLLSAELLLAAGNATQAIALLADQPGTTGPARRPEVVMLAQAHIAQGRPQAATSGLQNWLTSHPRDALAWQLLSAAYAAQGQTLRAIRADAESRVAVLDYAPASERLKAGQLLAREMASKGTADHIEASIIDTRAREVALQLRELLREQAVER